MFVGKDLNPETVQVINGLFFKQPTALVVNDRAAPKILGEHSQHIIADIHRPFCHRRSFLSRSPLPGSFMIAEELLFCQ